MPNTWHSFILRPATNEDGAAVRELIYGVLREFGLQPDPDATDADLQDLEASYAGNGGWFAVAVGASGDIVGSAGIYALDETTCELRKMYLLPAARGCGLGRKLLEDALASARRLGFRRVTLETAGVLEKAVALYTHYGFRPCVSAHLAPRADQAYFLELTNEADR